MKMWLLWFRLKPVSLFYICMLPLAYSINEYATPSVTNKFNKFRLTDSIPSDGVGGSGTVQSAITFGGFSRVYFTFNFKGRGNAQILVQEDSSKPNDNSLTVEIGGGANFDEVNIYDGRLQTLITQTFISNITSPDEFRSFWILLDNSSQEAYVGMCHDPGQNLILNSTGSLLQWSPLFLSISTSSVASGEWQIPSDGETLGGCNTAAGTNCLDVNTTCVSSGSFLHGTCVYPTEQVPDSFGTGVCRTLCGSAICEDNQYCDSGMCITIKDTSSTSTASTTSTTSTTSTSMSTSSTTSTPLSSTSTSTGNPSSSSTLTSTSSTSTITSTITNSITTKESSNVNVGLIVGCAIGGLALTSAIGAASFLLGRSGFHCGQVWPSIKRSMVRLIVGDATKEMDTLSGEISLLKNMSMENANSTCTGFPNKHGNSKDEYEDDRQSNYDNERPSSREGLTPNSDIPDSPVSLVDLTLGEERLQKYLDWNDF